MTRRLDVGHDDIGRGLVYCRKMRDSSLSVIWSGHPGYIYCKLCGLPVVIPTMRKNPVPSFALLVAKLVRTGHPIREARELAAQKLEEAAGALRGGKNNPLSKVAEKYSTLKEKILLRRLKQKLLSGQGFSKKDGELLSALYDKGVGRAKRISRQNPRSKNGLTKIYGKTEKIFMQKTSGPYKGERFVHDFKGGVRQDGIPRGAVLTLPGGKQYTFTTRAVVLSGKKDLWRNFKA